MLSNDTETTQAMALLYEELQAAKRPLVIWIGAGASAWANYPLWQTLTSEMHADFSRHVRGYEKSNAADSLEIGDFPAVFEFMRLADAQRYRAMLVSAFSTRPVGPHFKAFIELLETINPLHIVTTNVDEELERNLPTATLVQRSDIERATYLLHKRESFICKLHGSISAVDSMVFATSDYKKLEMDESYLGFLQSVLADSNVVFLGYGVRDEYVINQLMQGREKRKLFGGGSHFVISPQAAFPSPSHLRRIQYLTSATPDHRGALEVIHLIAEAKSQGGHRIDNEKMEVRQPTIYYLADFLPYGKHSTSYNLTVTGEIDTIPREVMIGEGYVDGEVSVEGYSALHDLVVGLICFDQVYVKLNDAGKLHDVVGSENFWRLSAADAIGLVHIAANPALTYPGVGLYVGGDFGDMESVEKVDGDGAMQRRTVRQSIRRVIAPVPGMERQAEDLFDNLEKKVFVLQDDGHKKGVESALVNPSVRRLLGISAGVTLNSVPKWVAYPLLRLAKVVQTASVCEQLGASATRMIWGSEHLAGAAFQAKTASEWVDSAASYALTGRFDSDLGVLVRAEPEIFGKILSFRESESGLELRREIASHLKTNQSSSLVAAINSGLRQTIPLTLLQKARDQMSGLFTPIYITDKLTPAILGDLRNGDKRIAQWRERSKKILKDAELSLKISPYGQCPCGSGVKFRFCCHEALYHKG